MVNEGARTIINASGTLFPLHIWLNLTLNKTTLKSLGHLYDLLPIWWKINFRLKLKTFSEMCPNGRTRFCVQIDDYSRWNEPLSKACLINYHLLCQLWLQASDTSSRSCRIIGTIALVPPKQNLEWFVHNLELNIWIFITLKMMLTQ